MYPNAATALPLPPRPNLDQYKKLAKDLVKGCRSGQPGAIREWAVAWIGKLQAAHEPNLAPEVRRSMGELLDELEEFARSRLIKPDGGRCALSDAQFVIARAHGFKSWPRFASHVDALAGSGSAISRFEAAADAVVSGDAATLKRLLGEDPALARARSTRDHQGTLLHYVGANGYEPYRQKSPANAVEIAKLLLEGGAEADAADAMGMGTTLGLVATSVHPERVGVQISLLETLLAHGAAVDGAPGGWNPLLASLRNGRPRSAELLAARGARLDLEGAAGLGRLDLVEGHFNPDGSPKANATKEQLERAFVRACEYGRNTVVEFLLERGVDLRAGEKSGQTGLHCAVIGRQLDTVKLLLSRGAPLEAMNCHGGTVLDQAMWCVSNGDGTVDYVPVIEALIAAGARLDLYPGFKERVESVVRRPLAR